MQPMASRRARGADYMTTDYKTAIYARSRKAQRILCLVG
jgi:hypothetical protein